MVKLLDQYGVPIPADQMQRPIAGPDLAHFRQPWTGMYQSVGLTPMSVANAMRSADAGFESPWLHLAEEMEEKDGHWAALLGVRKRQVEQLPIAVVAAGEDPVAQEHAEFLRRWVDTGCLTAAIFDMMDAVAKGFSVHEIEWETTPDHIWPCRLIYRYPRWFGIDRMDGETVKLRDGFNLQELPAWKFVIHTARFKSGALIRGGLARVAVWSWMFKAFTMKDWASFVQNYGQPIRLGRYGAGATERDKEALWQAISNIAGDMAAMVPTGMQLEFIGMKEAAGTAKIYEDRCKYLDQQMSKLVLGGTATVDAISGGHAVSQEHEKLRKDIERADANALSATLTKQLAALIISLNFGPQIAYPQIRIGRPDELPLPELVAAIDKLGKQGLTVGAAEIRRRLGVPDPQPGDELVGGRPPVAAAPGGMDPESAQEEADEAAADATQEAIDDAKNELAEGEKPEPAMHAKKQIEPFDLVDGLVKQLASDAGASLADMVEQIRTELNAATSIPEALARLNLMDLDSGRFGEMLGRSMALAHLAGQATVIDESGG